VWTTDEGGNGIAVHVANDRRTPLRADLRLALYSAFERRVGEATIPVELSAGSAASFDAEALLERFVDASWSYRFGPPPHDVLVASLERDGELISQACRFVAGRPLVRLSATQLGLRATIEGATLAVTSRRLAYGVRIHGDGCTPADDAFSVEPGATRRIALGAPPRGGVSVSALNLATPVRAGM
jgi:beta-mannosidase